MPALLHDRENSLVTSKQPEHPASLQNSPAPEPRGSRFALGTALVAVCVLGAFGGYFDFILTLLHRPESLGLLASPLLPPLGTALFLIVFCFLFWLLVAVVASLLRKGQAKPLAIGCAVGVGVFFVVCMSHYALRFPSLGDGVGPCVDGLVFLVPMGFAGCILGYFVSRALVRSERGRAWAKRLLFGALFLLCGVGVSMGGGRFPLGLVQHGVVWVVVAGLFAGLWGYRRATPAWRWTVAYLAVTCLALQVLAGAWRDTRPRPEQFHREGRVTRHIVLLTVDTLRRDGPTCLGGNPGVTPEIDRLLENSVVFDGAVAPTGWTLPSFASIMTGVSPAVHLANVRESKLPAAFVTLAEHLSAEDYDTAAIGRNAFMRSASSMNQGFNTYDFFPKLLPEEVSFGLLLVDALTGVDGSTENLADLACEWLNRHRDEDFFLWLHFFDPHMPYTPPKAFWPDGTPPEGMGYEFRRFNESRTGHWVPTPEERAWVRALYDGELRYVDHNIGRVLDTMKALGLYDGALIAFSADHGEEIFDHGSVEHGHTLYNELLDVPLAFKLPGNACATTIAERVCVGSIGPTVLDLCGVAYDKSLYTYSSLEPYWRAPGSVEERPIHAMGLLYYENREAVLFDRWKFIHWFTSGKEELYDLAADPGEIANVLAAHADVVEHARDLLAEEHAEAAEMRGRNGVGQAETTTLDPQTVEQLRNLGYIY